MRQPADRQIAMESILLDAAPADFASTILDQSEAHSFDRSTTFPTLGTGRNE